MKTYAIWNTSGNSINPSCSRCGSPAYIGEASLNPPTDKSYPDECPRCHSKIVLNNHKLILPLEIGSKVFILGHTTPVAINRLSATADGFGFGCEMTDTENESENDNGELPPILDYPAEFSLEDIGSYVFENAEEANKNWFEVHAEVHSFITDREKISAKEISEILEDKEYYVSHGNLYEERMFDNDQEATAYAESLSPETKVTPNDNGTYTYTLLTVSKSKLECASIAHDGVIVKITDEEMYFETNFKN